MKRLPNPLANVFGCSRSADPPRRPYSAPRRRGVLLLVVLSLLVLFALLGITYALVAGQYLRTTRVEVRNERVNADPSRMLESVLGQIVRGTTNQNSVIRGHDLLGDIYGNDGLNVTVTSITPFANGQLLDLAVNIDLTQSIFKYRNDVNNLVPVISDQQLLTPGYFNGCVLTLVDGTTARDISTRIVGWACTMSTVTTGTATVRVMAFDGASVGTMTGLQLRCIINGRPFNGTGFGFNTTLPPATSGTLLDASQEIKPSSGTNFKIPYVFLPNAVYSHRYNPTAVNIIPNILYREFGGIGGADEGYDAADVQSMLVAYMPLNPSAVGGPNITILPSLHRPDTIAYLRAKYGPLIPTTTDPDANALIERQASLRPHVSAHPQFPQLPGNTLITGPYDVDNDLDGIKESIWIDPGLPVLTGPDGRQYKPLAAILVLDRDSRLNVNVAGGTAHVDAAYLPPSSLTNSGDLPFSAYPAAPVNMARGSGVGPPEISLQPLFQALSAPLLAPASASPQYANLLAERYREPNSSLSVYPAAYNGNPAASPRAGITNFADTLAGANFIGYPISAFPNKPSSFATPLDMAGIGYQWLDVTGMPVRRFYGPLPTVGDNPYEMNLSQKVLRASASPSATIGAITDVNAGTTPNPIDSPFSAAELERLLRLYDIDAQELPDRLRKLIDPDLNGLLAGNAPAPILARNMITTDSNDLPSPSIIPTHDMRDIAANPLDPTKKTVLASTTLADLLRVRLAQGNLPPAQVNTMIQRMLPPELIAGLRFDINRVFGNGRDDDNDGIVDEPDEPEIQYWSSDNSAPSNFVSDIRPNISNGMDLDNLPAGPPYIVDVADKKRARQLYARYLYVLMMLLKDTGATLEFDGKPSTKTQLETAYAMAQWAVNVVDFRDRDSIMTGFEFDIEPFDADGWNVDGDLSTTTEPQRGVVWGCERPELLISETLAWHDKRTQNMTEEVVDATLDASTATAGGLVGDPDPMKVDSDYDQKLKPFGPFFIELYNPWNSQSSVKDVAGRPATSETSGEYYAVDPTVPTSSGVYLQKASTVGNSPMWRMIVVKGNSKLVDPDLPTQLGGTFQKADVDRAIYFRDPGAAITDLTAAVSYFPQLPPAPLLPGRYAVVGSAGLPGKSDVVAKRFVSPIGRITGGSGAASETNNTRRIELLPQANPYVNQVFVYNNSAAAGLGNSSPFGETVGAPDLGRAHPAIAIALTGSSAGSFPTVTASITEPKDGYASLAGGPPSGTDLTSGEQTYMPKAFDIPFDKRNTNLTTLPPGPPVNYAKIHLQRLADPTQAWNVDTNPYMTIDTMSIDVTIFNGVETGDPNTPALTTIGTSQRGDDSTVVVGSNPEVLWSQEPPRTVAAPSPALMPAAQTHIANAALGHSLGYLNKNYGNAELGSAYNSVDAPQPGYLGMPKHPKFASMAWLNRPFVGPMEMMLVPRSHSSRLLYDYATLPQDMYTPTTPADNTRATGHLLNFFTVPTALAPSPGLESLFEYLQVPSMFAGTKTYLDPNQPNFGTLNPAPLPAQDANELAMMSFFHTPFNYVSSYRDPGKLNINLIPSDDGNNLASSIWNGFLNGYVPGTAGPSWQNVFNSRQGLVGPVTLGLAPTLFNNPFRSGSEASLLLPDAYGFANRDNIDVTMLRPMDPATSLPPSVAMGDLPLFDYQAQAGALDNPGTPTTRHPAFRIKNLQRTSNLLTTRSNVYAIWITIGYFEVTPGGDLATNPDGYQLGPEIGSDTGEVKRNRAFFIYDRSIPVAYEPGKDHNYQQGLLLKRFIE